MYGMSGVAHVMDARHMWSHAQAAGMRARMCVCVCVCVCVSQVNLRRLKKISKEIAELPARGRVPREVACHWNLPAAECSSLVQV